MENTGIPRLLRDAQVLPIWEGTTNVLSVDVLRALSGTDSLKQVLGRVQAAIDAASTRLPDVAEALATAARRLAADAEAAAERPEVRTRAGRCARI